MIPEGLRNVRFKHLTDADLEAIQQMVDEDWQLLQRKAGLSAL